jgi:hypothetical protein
MPTGTTDVHAQSIATAISLTRYHIELAISPLTVIKALNGAHVSFVLIGTYAIGGWMRKPRASAVVDVLVASLHVPKAKRQILEVNWNCAMHGEDAASVCLRDRRSELAEIHIAKPHQPLLRETFRHTASVTLRRQNFRIPNLEMAIAMKFARLVDPECDQAEWFQDAHDFIRMVKQNDSINLGQLAELGGLVHSGGGNRLKELVKRTRAGEKFRV